MAIQVVFIPYSRRRNPAVVLFRDAVVTSCARLGCRLIFAFIRTVVVVSSSYVYVGARLYPYGGRESRIIASVFRSAEDNGELSFRARCVAYRRTRERSDISNNDVRVFGDSYHRAGWRSLLGDGSWGWRGWTGKFAAGVRMSPSRHRSERARAFPLTAGGGGGRKWLRLARTAVVRRAATTTGGFVREVMLYWRGKEELPQAFSGLRVQPTLAEGRGHAVCAYAHSASSGYVLTFRGKVEILFLRAEKSPARTAEVLSKIVQYV